MSPTTKYLLDALRENINAWTASPLQSQLFREAADEIEYLQAKLDRLAPSTKD